MIISLNVMNMNRIVLTPLCQRVPYTLIMLEDILAKNVTENANTVSQSITRRIEFGFTYERSNVSDDSPGQSCILIRQRCENVIMFLNLRNLTSVVEIVLNIRFYS